MESAITLVSSALLAVQEQIKSSQISVFCQKANFNFNLAISGSTASSSQLTQTTATTSMTTSAPSRYDILLKPADFYFFTIKNKKKRQDMDLIPKTRKIKKLYCLWIYLVNGDGFLKNNNKVYIQQFYFTIVNYSRVKNLVYTPQYTLQHHIMTVHTT